MEPNKKRQPMHGLFVLSVEDRKLFFFVVALLLVFLVGIGTLGGLALHTANRVDKTSRHVAANTRHVVRNTRAIAAQQRRDAAQQREDTLHSRHSDARQCARENLVRAEIHVAYQSGQAMPPPENFASEPILRVLLNAARENQEHGLKRVRRNLPILECAPNLTGHSAYPLSARKQKRFVELYEAGKLDPTPSALDAQTGPDE
jgi:hypothetical protein